MEREDYQKRIDDLLNAVRTLLDANNAMGEKQKLATADKSSMVISRELPKVGGIMTSLPKRYCVK